MPSNKPRKHVFFSVASIKRAGKVPSLNVGSEIGDDEAICSGRLS